MHEALVRSAPKLGVVVHAYSPSTGEGESRGLGQGQPCLYTSF